jgi:hypothetical protein
MDTIAHILHLQYKQSIEHKVENFRNNDLTQENENNNNVIKITNNIFHLQYKQSIEHKVENFRNDDLTQENENNNNVIKMTITITKSENETGNSK